MVAVTRFEQDYTTLPGPDQLSSAARKSAGFGDFRLLNCLMITPAAVSSAHGLSAAGPARATQLWRAASRLWLNYSAFQIKCGDMHLVPLLASYFNALMRLAAVDNMFITRKPWLRIAAGAGSSIDCHVAAIERIAAMRVDLGPKLRCEAN